MSSKYVLKPRLPAYCLNTHTLTHTHFPLLLYSITYISFSSLLLSPRNCLNRLSCKTGLLVICQHSSKDNHRKVMKNTDSGARSLSFKVLNLTMPQVPTYEVGIATPTWWVTVRVSGSAQVSVRAAPADGSARSERFCLPSPGNSPKAYSSGEGPHSPRRGFLSSWEERAHPLPLEVIQACVTRSLEWVGSRWRLAPLGQSTSFPVEMLQDCSSLPQTSQIKSVF